MDKYDPVTIFKSRYQGTYEGGRWVAALAEPTDSRLTNAVGGDIECMEWFAWPHGRNLGCGVAWAGGSTVAWAAGDSPQEAYINLAKSTCPWPAPDPDGRDMRMWRMPIGGGWSRTEVV